MIETVLLDTAITERLTVPAVRDLVTGIHCDHVAELVGTDETEEPSGTDYPYLLFSVASPGADTNSAGCRVRSDPAYLVRVVGGQEHTFQDLAPIAGAVDELLQDWHIESGAVVFVCQRETPYRLSYRGPGGARIYELGGIYRFQVRL